MLTVTWRLLLWQIIASAMYYWKCVRYGGKGAHKQGIPRLLGSDCLWQPTSEMMIFIQIFFSVFCWSVNLNLTSSVITTIPPTQYIIASFVFNLIHFSFIESKHCYTPNIIKLPKLISESYYRKGIAFAVSNIEGKQFWPADFHPWLNKL